MHGLKYVELSKLAECFRFFKEINDTPLDRIVWVDEHGHQIYPSHTEIEAWKWIGLSNRDFPSVHGMFKDQSLNHPNSVRVVTITKKPNEP